MGNTSSSTIAVAEVLKVSASEEKERGAPPPVADAPVPDDDDLRAGLLVLGVDLGEDTSMSGEKLAMSHKTAAAVRLQLLICCV